MITVKEVADIIEKAAPKTLAQEWDNVGLLVGDDRREVKKIMTALDVDMNVLSEAIEKNCDMIVSHHPLIFGHINFVTNENTVGEIILKAAENKVAIYSAHTNLDCTKGGTNDYLCSLFELKDVEICSGVAEDNLIRKGVLKTPCTIEEMAKKVGTKLGKKHVRIVGEKDKLVSTVALCSGGGAEYIPEVAHTCDLYITGDVKYHGAKLAQEKGLALIIAEHFDTEVYAMEILKKILENCPAEVITSQENKDVFEDIFI